MKLNAFPDHSILGNVLSLAHATFYDALPSNAQNRAAVAPATTFPPTRVGVLERSFEAIDNWFHRQRQNEREAWLAQSSDLCDLERRIRQLEHRPIY
jgi:hypothetical protein